LLLIYPFGHQLALDLIKRAFSRISTFHQGAHAGKNRSSHLRSLGSNHASGQCNRLSHFTCNKSGQDVGQIGYDHLLGKAGVVHNSPYRYSKLFDDSIFRGLVYLIAVRLYALLIASRPLTKQRLVKSVNVFVTNWLSNS
jgi:hypothetical protein